MNGNHLSAMMSLTTVGSWLIEKTNLNFNLAILYVVDNPVIDLPNYIIEQGLIDSQI